MTKLTLLKNYIIYDYFCQLSRNRSFLAKFSSLQNLKVFIYKGGVATAGFSKIEMQKKAL